MKELEKIMNKLNMSLKFEKSIKILNDIINEHRSPFIWTSLGYEEI